MNSDISFLKYVIYLFIYWGLHIKLRGQPAGIRSLNQPCNQVPGIKLKLPGLETSAFTH